MKDIAEKLNISINAVSLALNDKEGVSDETRSLVFRTAAELGYFRGTPVFTGGNISKNFCLMIENRYFKDINFYSKVILGIENEARKNNYDIIVNFMDRSNFVVPAAVESRKASGILIVGAIEDEYLEKVLRFGLPTVLVDHASNMLNVDSVLTQNMSGAYMAVSYLIKNGQKNISFFGSIDYTLSFRERWLGFYEGMKDRKNDSSSMLEGLAKNSITGPLEKYIQNKDYNAIAELLRSIEKMPDAWVCSNDDGAIALYNALGILGLKVPDDVSIVGFDDIDLCKIISPQLTTIRVNKELMGQRAVKRLLWRIEHEQELCEHIRLAVSLIERDSVKKLECIFKE